MVIVVNVPENVSAVGRVFEIRAQVRSADASVQGERSEEGLALEIWGEYFPRALHVVVDVSWKAVLGMGLCIAPGSKYRRRIHCLWECRAAMEPTSCNVLAWQSSAVACIS